MGTKGYRIWDLISNDVYESKHIKFDESRLYRDVVSTYIHDDPLNILDGRESYYNPSVESSDDSDDDSSPSQPQSLTPVRPAPKAPQRRPNVQEIQPYVSSRRKPVPVSTTPLKPTSSKGFNRVSIPNKPGWERVEVQRQSGATKGKWDIYFYAPGCKIPLRSRPEFRDYCEQALKIPYNPDEFNWKPSEPLVDTVSQVDTDGDDVAQATVQETDIDADSDPERYTVRVYLAEVVKEPSTFEEAMASPEKESLQSI
uniref:MBD domain-containing protein n=1 Tax=Strigamia maritima TaxID=126957 RepID=T1JFV9_STRMM